MRKIVSLLLLSITILSMVSTTAFAETTVGAGDNQSTTVMQPRLTYIVDAQTELRINNGLAVVDCWVKGNVLNATKAKVIAELQVKNSATNWIPVAIWTDTQNDFMAEVYETKEINSNNTYRVKATYTVWEGSQSETITIIGDEM